MNTANEHRFEHYQHYNEFMFADFVVTNPAGHD